MDTRNSEQPPCEDTAASMPLWNSLGLELLASQLAYCCKLRDA